MYAVEQKMVVRSHRLRCEASKTSGGDPNEKLRRALAKQKRIRKTGKTIDHLKLSSMSLSDLHMSPDDLICYDFRFGCTTRLHPDDEAEFDEFREDMSLQFTEQERIPYRNFSIAQLFRIEWADELGILPVKDEEEDKEED